MFHTKFAILLNQSGKLIICPNRMLGKEIDAFLVIPDDVFANDRFEIYAKNISNFTFNRQMEDFVSRTVIQQRMQENGLDSQLIKKLNRSVKANTFKLEKEGAKKQSSSAAFSVGYALGIYLIFCPDSLWKFCDERYNRG